MVQACTLAPCRGPSRPPQQLVEAVRMRLIITVVVVVVVVRSHPPPRRWLAMATMLRVITLIHPTLRMLHPHTHRTMHPHTHPPVTL